MLAEVDVHVDGTASGSFDNENLHTAPCCDVISTILW